MTFAGPSISLGRTVNHGNCHLAMTRRSLDGPLYTDTAANYSAVLDSELTRLTAAQTHIFTAVLSVVCVLSMCGNVGAFLVNIRRKIRPLFRACLISLAVSDLMNTVFLTTCYLAQFTADYIQIWSLGELMCSFVPFVTTSAILASSMTLVAIALDRYFAVMKAVIGFWNPSVVRCMACTLCIWLAATSVACPVFMFYDLKPVYILTKDYEMATQTDWPVTVANGEMVEVPQQSLEAAEAMEGATVTAWPWELEGAEENSSHDQVIKRRLVNMCTSDQENVSVYYAIVFAIIFVPCIVAFVWFNSIIAQKIWTRRHGAATRPPAVRGSTLSHSTAKASGAASDGSLNRVSNKCRESRHLRMFIIILVLMALFVFLRLPAWVFLLVRLYGNYSHQSSWILYFAFGLMNLTSSMLNPLFYTFLTEAIHYAAKFKTKIASLFCTCCVRRYCCCCVSCCYLSKYVERKKTAFGPTVPQERQEVSVHGTDVEGERNDCDSYECNPQVYTIFSPSFVSSSKSDKVV